MDDPKEGWLLTPNGATGLPTGSVRFFLTLRFYLCSLILPHQHLFFHKKSGHNLRYAPHFYRCNDRSMFSFFPHKSFYFSYKLFRSLQSAFICSSCFLSPSGTSILSVYILQSISVSHCCLILFALTHIPNLSDSELPYPYHINLFL